MIALNQAVAAALMAAQEHAMGNLVASARLAGGERSEEVLEDVIITLSARALGDRATDCSTHRDVLLQASSWLAVTQQTLASATEMMGQAGKALKALEVLKLEERSLSGEALQANHAAQIDQMATIQNVTSQVEFLVNDGIYGTFRQGVRTGNDTGYTASLTPDPEAALTISYQSIGDDASLEIHSTTIYVDDIKTADMTSKSAADVGVFYESVMDRVRQLRQAEGTYQTLGTVLQIRSSFCVDYVETLNTGASSLRQINVYAEATSAKMLQTRTRISMSALRMANASSRSNPAITAFG